MNKLKIVCYSSILCLVVLSLSGCGVPKEEKREAKRLYKQYKDEYKDAVTDIFGRDAELKDIKGEIENRKDSLWSQDHYYASGWLEGKLIIDGREYQSYYDPIMCRELSDVHQDDVISDCLKKLPFDQDDIIEKRINYYTNNRRVFVDFPNTTDYFESAVPITDIEFEFVTHEDLRHFTDKDYTENLEKYSYKNGNDTDPCFSIDIVNTDNGDGILICTLVNGGLSIKRSWEVSE